MSNSSFRFKQFTIRQDACAMKVGTDGVLLGAWADIANRKRVLDVGTGTGLIAIMCGQRSFAKIDGVEIDEKAYRQAMDNSGTCPWAERITMYQDSFQHFALNPPALYDFIISNPPYFKNSLKPVNLERRIARHDERLTYNSLLSSSSSILCPEGILALIMPAKDFGQVAEQAWFFGFYPARCTTVRPHAGKLPSRCLVEFSRDRSVTCISDELVIKEENTEEYTRDFIALTRDFYLKI